MFYGNHSRVRSSSDRSMALEIAHLLKAVTMMSGLTLCQALPTQLRTSCLVGCLRLPAAVSGRSSLIQVTQVSHTASLKGFAMLTSTGWASAVQPPGLYTTSTLRSNRASLTSWVREPGSYPAPTIGGRLPCPGFA